MHFATLLDHFWLWSLKHILKGLMAKRLWQSHGRSVFLRCCRFNCCFVLLLLLRLLLQQQQWGSWAVLNEPIVVLIWVFGQMCIMQVEVHVTLHVILLLCRHGQQHWAAAGRAPAVQRKAEGMCTSAQQFCHCPCY
jgi:hypothetical protein